MLCSGKFIFCLAVIRFAYSVPIQENFNVEAAENALQNNIQESTKKSVLCSKSRVNDKNSKCLEDSNYNPDASQDEVQMLSAPPMMMENKQEVPFIPDGRETVLPISGAPFEYMQPSYPLPPYWSRSQYHLNPDMEPLGVGLGAYHNYDGLLYPQAYPRTFAVNPGFPVNSLPPVHSTYIHGLLPAHEVQPKSNYDIDVLNSQNTMLLPTLARPGRMLRTSEDDFLTQLSHDAIMNNILPSVPVPFMRYTGRSAAPYSYGAYGGPSAVAVFPNAPTSGCAVPLLFSCTPKITRGVVQQEASSEFNQASVAGPHKAYRQPQPVIEPDTKKSSVTEHVGRKN